MQFISTAEAAKRLGVHERHVRWLILKKHLRSQKVGRAHLVEVESLAGWKRTNRGLPKANGGKGLKKSRKKVRKSPDTLAN